MAGARRNADTTMTPQAQRIAIAEACGWDCDPELTHKWDSRGQWASHPNHEGGKLVSKIMAVPKYPSELNAMHEAEKGLDYNQMNRYQNIELSRFVHTGTTWICSATATQRAEAFLRTLNLWDDTK